MKNKTQLLAVIFAIYSMNSYAGAIENTKPIEQSSGNSLLIIIIVTVIALTGGILFGIQIGKRKK